MFCHPTIELLSLKSFILDKEKKETAFKLNHSDSSTEAGTFLVKSFCFQIKSREYISTLLTKLVFLYVRFGS